MLNCSMVKTNAAHGKLRNIAASYDHEYSAKWYRIHAKLRFVSVASFSGSDGASLIHYESSSKLSHSALICSLPGVPMVQMDALWKRCPMSVS